MNQFRTTVTDAKGVRTKLGFTFRYSPAIRQIKKWIDDGTLGEVPEPVASGAAGAPDKMGDGPR